MKNKKNKLSIYTTEIIPSNREANKDILKNIQLLEEDNPEIASYKNLIEESFQKNEKINEKLIEFIEVIFLNCTYFSLFKASIKNKKLICNIIQCTSINLNQLKINKDLSFEEQINSMIYYFKTNYVNCSLNSQMNRLEEIKAQHNNIDLLCYVNNSQFATINQNCSLQIWSALTNEKLFTLNEHTNNITSLIPLKNGIHFATASDDSTIKIWDFTQGKCLKTIVTQGNPFLIYDVFGKESQIGCLPYRNSLNIYDYSDKPKNIFNKSLEDSIPWIEGLYQFPNDGRIILASSGFFQVFSPNIEEIKKIVIKDETPKIFYRINNGDLAVGLFGNEIFIYDNDVVFKTRLIGHKGTISSLVQFDEKLLLSSSLDSNIMLWSTIDYELVACFINSNYSINSMILLSKNKILTSSKSNEHSLGAWKIEMFSNSNTNNNCSNIISQE